MLTRSVLQTPTRFFWKSAAAQGATQCVFGPDQLQLELPAAQSPNDFAARVLAALCNERHPTINTSLWDLDASVQEFLDSILVISLYIEQRASSDRPEGLWGAAFRDLTFAYMEAVQKSCCKALPILSDMPLGDPARGPVRAPLPGEGSEPLPPLAVASVDLLEPAVRHLLLIPGVSVVDGSPLLKAI